MGKIAETINGLQHIGLPTNDLEKTVAFYEGLGFSVALRTVNEAAGEQVAFLQLKELMIEAYQTGRAAGLIGFDHQFFQLQKGYLFPRGFVDRTQRNGEAQPFVKGHRFLQVVCRQADVLQAIYGFRDFSHVHASLSSTSISTFIVVSRFASMYWYAAR